MESSCAYSRPPEILNPEIVNLQKIVNKSFGPDDSIKKTPKIVNKKDSKRPWADFLTLGLCAASQLKVVKPEKNGNCLFLMRFGHNRMKLIS